MEAGKSIRNVKIILLVLMNVIGFGAVMLFVDSQKAPTPDVHMIGFEWSPYYSLSPYCPNHYVSVEGTVFNSGLVAATNVTLKIEIYVTPFTLLKTENMALGNISANSYVRVTNIIPYPSSLKYMLSNVGYDLLWAGTGSVFLMDPLWLATICAAATVVLLVLDVYFMRDLGFFMWLKVRKRLVALTVGWSAAVASVIIKSYWLLYVEHPVLVEYGVVWSEVIDWTPRLNIWDLVLILVISIIAGALLLNIELAVYSLVTSFILGFVIAVTYSTLFIWFSLGWGEFFAPGGGFLEWGLFVVLTASKIIFRMTFPIVHMFCLLGVFLGAFTRGYLQPSAELDANL